MRDCYGAEMTEIRNEDYISEDEMRQDMWEFKAEGAMRYHYDVHLVDGIWQPTMTQVTLFKGRWTDHEEDGIDIPLSEFDSAGYERTMFVFCNN